MENLYQIFLESTGVTIDSRTATQGSIFFAIKGENKDGNHFALAALEAGAAYAVISESSEELLSSNYTDRLILTEDTLTTLQQLAAHHRRQLGIPFVALTGTNGKTTTKELITAILSKEYNVGSTSGNLNNHLGVPLTILSMKIGYTEIGVVEMGASAPGEIGTLAAIAAPDVALITNLGKAHLLGFGSFDGVKKTKGELYDYIADNGGTIVYDHDNPNLVEMLSEREFSTEPIPYGIEYQKTEILPASEEKPFLTIRLANGTLISTKLFGDWNTENIIAAIAVGKYFGITSELAAKAIAEYTPTNNRSQLTYQNGNTIIADLYNANPTSMRTVLEYFAATKFSCKNLILGDMRELGNVSQAEHKAILELIERFDSIAESFFVGPEFRKSSDGIAIKGAQFFNDSEELQNYLTKETFTGKTFLIKGSRGIKLEGILSAF